ncbi:hypothetical protein chiPu_0031138, partial [Chiloscyllium punctatum]|nr:hypothetical protein [Chiloscyllium punctatum]
RDPVRDRHGEEIARRRKGHQGRKQHQACDVEDHGVMPSSWSCGRERTLAANGEQSGKDRRRPQRRPPSGHRQIAKAPGVPGPLMRVRRNRLTSANRRSC